MTLSGVGLLLPAPLQALAPWPTHHTLLSWDLPCLTFYLEHSFPSHDWFTPFQGGLVKVLSFLCFTPMHSHPITVPAERKLLLSQIITTGNRGDMCVCMCVCARTHTCVELLVTRFPHAYSLLGQEHDESTRLVHLFSAVPQHRAWYK